MGTAIRSEAQQRADEIAIFQAELSRLEREGVLRLDAAQHETISAHHAAPGALDRNRCRIGQEPAVILPGEGAAAANAA